MHRWYFEREKFSSKEDLETRTLGRLMVSQMPACPYLEGHDSSVSHNQVYPLSGHGHKTG